MRETTNLSIRTFRTLQVEGKLNFKSLSKICIKFLKLPLQNKIYNNNYKFMWEISVNVGFNDRSGRKFQENPRNCCQNIEKVFLHLDFLLYSSPILCKSFLFFKDLKINSKSILLQIEFLMREPIYTILVSSTVFCRVGTS